MLSKIREVLAGNISNVTTNLIWGISLAIPFFVVWGDYAATGWAISFILLSSIVVLLKQEKNHWIWLTYSSIVIFSIFLIVRINPLLTFFNFWAILYLIAFLSKKPNFKLDLLNVILLPFLPLAYLTDEVKSFPLKLQFFKNLKIEYKNEKENKIPWTEVLAGLGITLVVMILILPFLASSNPLFASHLVDFISFFNIFNWAKTINSLFLNTFLFPRFIIFIICIFSFAKIFSVYANSKRTDEVKKQSTEINTKMNLTWLLPKILTSLVLAVFISSQMELYMASKSQLAQMGYAYGSLINEIFFQLSFVAIVVFGLLYFDRSKKLSHSIFSIILMVQAFFILGVALKTNLDYIQTWGLTLKRLYGLAVYSILVLGYFWHFFCRYSQRTIHTFWKGVSAVILICLILINFINFDRVIYTYNQNLGDKVDECSYIDTLSSDAEIPQETYDRIVKKASGFMNDPSAIGCKNAQNKIETNTMILYSKCKTNGLSGMYASWNNVFTFNYSKYEECKRINDRINTVTFNNETYK